MRKTLYFLLIMLIFCGGCRTLRRKFVRKRNYKKETPVYVDLKDYSGVPSRQLYVDYSTFVRGWLGDLIQALEDNLSYKRQKRAIGEVIVNLDRIISLYSPEGKAKIDHLYRDFLRVQDKLCRGYPLDITEAHALQREVERLRLRFEADFQYSDAQQWL